MKPRTALIILLLIPAYLFLIQPASASSPQELQDMELIGNIIKLVRENVDLYEAISDKSPLVNREQPEFARIKVLYGLYPETRAGFLSGFLTYLPENRTYGDDVIYLARKGFRAAQEIEDLQSRSLLQASFALLTAPNNFQEAEKMADRIEGPRTRERILTELGISPYRELPGDTKQQIVYYQNRARATRDIRKKASYHMASWKAAIAVNRENPFTKRYFGVYKKEDYEYFPQLAQIDPALALEYLAIRREAHRLMQNESSSNYDAERAAPEIEYIRDRARINPADALRETEQIDIGIYSLPARAGALIEAARIIHPQAPGKARKILEQAEKILRKVPKDHRSYFEIFGHDLKLTPTKPDDTSEEVKPESIQSKLRRFVREERIYLLSPVYEEAKNPEELLKFLRTQLAPEVEKIKDPGVRAVWKAHLAVIYRKADLDREAEKYMRQALDLTNRYHNSIYQFPETDVMEAYLEFDTKAAQTHIEKTYFHASVFDRIRLDDLFSVILKLDPQYIVTFMKQTPAKIEQGGTGITFIIKPGEKEIRLDKSIASGAGRYLLKSEGFDSLASFIKEWQNLAPHTWEVVYREAADEALPNLINHTREIEEDADRFFPTLAIFEKDPRTAEEIILTMDDELKPGMIRHILFSGRKNISSAVLIMESIESPAVKLRGVLDIITVLHK